MIKILELIEGNETQFYKYYYIIVTLIYFNLSFLNFKKSQ